MKNKKLVLAVVALVAVVAVFLGIYLATRPETSQGAKSITVTVIHSDGTTKDFQYRTDEEYLGPVILEEGLVTGNMGAYGLEIKSVDGEEAVWSPGAAHGAYWALYVGDEYAMTGADSTPIADGDVFKLVYTLG